MKKISILFAALAAAFAVSCNKENPVETPDTSAPAGMKQVTITASIEEPDTKTSYDADGKFSWTKGDQISVMGTGYGFYTLTATSDGPTTTFTGWVPEGVTLRQEAFFPADPGICREGSSYYYSIPEYKDLTSSGSVDIPMGAYSGTKEYKFQHMTGAAQFTFTNFPAGVVSAEVSIVNASLKISGVFGTHLSNNIWTYGVKAASNESEGKFVRKVPVVDNTAQLYLPYAPDGNLWAECTVNVKGYDAKGNELHLLKDKKMSGFAAFPRATIIPMKPLELPSYTPPVDWSKVDWTSTDVKEYIQPDWFVAEYSQYTALEELKVIADENYVYARVKPSTTVPVEKIRFKFASTAEGTTEEWYWSTKYASAYKSSWATITDNNFALIYDSVAVELKSEVEGDEVYWNLAFPRNGHALTKDAGTVYIGLLSYGNGTENGFVPMIWNSMLMITLP